MSGRGYGLTARARELLVYLSERETCPNFEEMREALGLSSKSSVARLLDQLENRGFIYRHKHRVRAIEVIQRAKAELAPITIIARKPSDVVYIPLLGRID